MKFILIFTAFFLCGSCRNNQQNQFVSDAAQMVVSEGGGASRVGYRELKLSKSGKNSSLFKGSVSLTVAPKIADLKIDKDTFSEVQKIFATLEVSAVPKDELMKQLNLGLRRDVDWYCDEPDLHSTTLLVTWSYATGLRKVEHIDLGCQNEVAEKIRTSYSELVEKLELEISPNAWKPVKSKFGVEGE